MKGRNEMDESDVLSKLKEEFPDALQHETGSYTAFSVKNEKGKKRNFIQISKSRAGIKIALLSRFLSSQEKTLFTITPKQHGWAIDADYIIQSEADLVAVLPFIRKSYEGVRLSEKSFAEVNEQVIKERDKMKSILKTSLITSRNLILRGAPGTGKTYLAKQIAEELTGGNPEQIGFVQFHPSYDYTDFVEGLRPVKDDSGEIKFDIKPGIFKEFCQKAIKSSKSGGQDNFDEAWETFWEAVSDEPDGYKMKTLKGKPMNLVAYEKGDMTGVTEKESNSRFYNRNQCYNVYRGLPGTPKGGFDTYRKAIIKEMAEKFGLKPYQAPKDIHSDKKFVFIIDEINRGEISKIFGELFYAIDPGYRGKKGEISTQYANMHEGEEKFYIPENVYIIGTMNDIDRSVDSFDFAMRRRFRFVEIKAEDCLGMWKNQLDGSKILEATVRLRHLNQAIEKIADLNRNYHIGPSYFLALPQLDYDYERLWQDYIQPLLEEYLRGSYQEVEQLEELKAAFDKLEETNDVD
ncbi:TPA: AAA family ATPase [Streptococcus suis]|nr:AAA family ATPase [Streptococcus suis]